MNILFTICGRAGSKGFKNKNLKKLKNIPLVYYTLSVIKLYIEKHINDNVIVAINTDSDELKKIVREQDLVKNIFWANRRMELAGDIIPKVEVIKDTYLQYIKGEDIDIVVDLDITSPLRKLNDLENAIEKLKIDNNIDVVYSVVPSRRSPYFNMVEKKGNYYKKICESNYTARQQAPETYELNASIYAYNPKFLKSNIEKTILDYDCDIIIMDDYLVLDIDSEDDFVMMAQLLDIWIQKDIDLKRVIDEASVMNKGRKTIIM